MLYANDGEDVQPTAPAADLVSNHKPAISGLFAINFAPHTRALSTKKK